MSLPAAGVAQRRPGALGRIRLELLPVLELALPLALAELGWMAMGVVDTVMVGHLPHAAVPLSATALAQMIFSSIVWSVGGLLLGLDTTLSQAHGADDYARANRWLWQGLLLAGAIAGVNMVLCALAALALPALAHDAAISGQAGQALFWLALGNLPLLLYFALRRYLQAFNHVRVITAALLSANLVNLVFDWLLIFAHSWRLGPVTLSWPAMGVVGSAIATTLARVYLFLFALTAITLASKRNRYGLFSASLWHRLQPDWPSLRQLIALGLPSGATMLVEIAVFSVVIALSAQLGPGSLAGNQIALTVASFTYMMPLGISAAASVRVGQAIGRGSSEQAHAAGWAAIVMGAVVMLGAAAVLISLPAHIAHAFTQDSTVVAATLPLLTICAFFQLFDGIQVTVVGALRGAGDTRSGLIAHLLSYWLLGLPLGAYLCFNRHAGASGLWLGLCIALIVIGLSLLVRWSCYRITIPADRVAPATDWR